MPSTSAGPADTPSLRANTPDLPAAAVEEPLGAQVFGLLTTPGDLAYAAGLLVAALFVLDALRSRGLVVTDRLALAGLPWAVAAASLSVLTRVVDLPRILSSALSSPLVYLTTFVLAGSVCVVVSDRLAEDSMWTVPELLAVTGTLLVAPIVGATLALDGRRLDLLWPAVGLAASVAMTLLLWEYLAARSPATTARTGYLGMAVLFGHLLDANTTLIGIDVLGFAERTPLSRGILEFAGTLPTADLLGVGWLFLLVKAAIAVAVVRLVAVAVAADAPHRPVLLGVTAVAGLGPGVHNLVLYTLV